MVGFWNSYSLGLKTYCRLFYKLSSNINYFVQHSIEYYVPDIVTNDSKTISNNWSNWFVSEFQQALHRCWLPAHLQQFKILHFISLIPIQENLILSCKSTKTLQEWILKLLKFLEFQGISKTPIYKSAYPVYKES